VKSAEVGGNTGTVFDDATSCEHHFFFLSLSRILGPGQLMIPKLTATLLDFPRLLSR